MRHGESFWWFTAGSLIQKGNLGIYWYFGAMMILYALLPMQHKLYVKYPKAFLLGTIVLGIVSNSIFLSNFYGYEIEENTIKLKLKKIEDKNLKFNSELIFIKK